MLNAAKKKRPQCDVCGLFLLVLFGLPPVADAKGTGIAESACRAQHIPLRTEVERDLERHGLEVVLQSSLGKETKAEVAFAIAIPYASVGTHTGKPAKVASNTAHPLINSRKIEVAIGFMLTPAQIEFQTIVGVETMLEREFGTRAATESATYANPILSVRSNA